MTRGRGMCAADGNHRARLDPGADRGVVVQVTAVMVRALPLTTAPWAVSAPTAA
jgi:hypothetical protein